MLQKEIQNTQFVGGENAGKLRSKPKAFLLLYKVAAVVRKICTVNKRSNLHWSKKKKKGALRGKPHPTKLLVNERNSLKEFSAPKQKQQLL